MLLKCAFCLIAVILILNEIFCYAHNIDSDINQEYYSLSVPYTDPLKVQSSTKGDLCVQHQCKGRGISQKKCLEYIERTECRGPFRYTFFETASPGEYPHIVFISEKNSDRHCEGTLLSPRYVLTTAECSTRDIDSVSIGDFTYTVPIKNVTIHPHYEPKQRKDDIALIELGMEVTFSDGIRPACLWAKKEIPKDPIPVITTISKAINEYIVEKNSVDVIDREKCVSEHPISQLKLDKSHYCGMLDEVCVDVASGSPMQIVTKEGNSCVYQVIGLASERVNTCSPEPVIFTKVVNHIYWIESVIWPKK